MDPTTRLLLLRSLLNSSLDDLERRQEVIRVANQLLADPKGPAPDEVLSIIAKQISSGEPFAAATNQIEFAGLPDDRRDAAIAYTIRAAGSHALAASWLNHRLLGAGDPRLVHRTLEMLQLADTGPTAITPVVQGLFNLALAPRYGNGEGGALKLELERPIPITSDQHSIFRALSSSDQEVYTLAWHALPLFEIPSAGGAAERSEYDLLLDAAFARAKTPPQIVAFLEKQPDKLLSTVALIRVVVRGEQAVAANAARVLYGSNRPIAEGLFSFSDKGLRERFAAQMYEALRGEASPVVGLMRQDGEQPKVVQWFGKKIAAGDLPEAGQWVASYNEEQLLKLAGSPVDLALARGAVVALATSRGSTLEYAKELAQRLTTQNDRTLDGLRKS